jgi:WD40 repeat protein
MMPTPLGGLGLLLEDALRFIREFRTPMVYSAAQIYISALPFCPQSTSIFNAFSARYDGGVFVRSGADMLWTPCIAKLEGHLGPVHTVRFSPDGSKIVSASDEIRVWDFKTGAQMGQPFGHAEGIFSMVFSPDGSHIATASNDKCQVWELDTGIATSAILDVFIGTILCVAFDQEGRQLLLGSYGRTENDSRSYYVSSIALSADRSQSVAGTENTIWLSKQSSSTRAYRPLMAFSPAGNQVVTSWDDDKLCIWDIQTGNTIATTQERHSSAISSVAYSPDGNYIVSGSHDKTVRVWDLRGVQIAISAPLSDTTRNFPLTVALSHDGNHFLAGAHEKTLHVFEKGTGTAVHPPFEGHTSAILSAAFSPDGSTIVSGSYDKSLRLWDSKIDVNVDMSPDSTIFSVAFSPDGKRFVSASTEIRLWDADTGVEIGRPLEDHAAIIPFVAFAPDGFHIVSVSCDDKARIWNLETRDAIVTPLPVHLEGIIAMFSPDSLQIVTCSFSPNMFVRDLQTGSIITLSWKERVISSIFSPDGSQIVSGFEDGTLTIWDSKTGAPISTLLNFHLGPVLSVAFSQDGAWIASGSLDKTLRVWNIETDTDAGVAFKGHTAAIQSIAFSLDSSHIIAASSREQIIWDIQNRRPVVLDQDARDNLDLGENNSRSPFMRLLDNGWVVGLDNQNIFWIPADHRGPWASYGTRMVLGGRHLTMLDASSISLDMN